MSIEPMVSVVVTTYQHAPYIEACLHGILSQRTDFPVEILVGEDESSDGTRAICQRIAAEHPDRISLYLRSRKDVIKVFGKPTGRANFVGLIASAKGRYVALCEGDDHWIDPLKLQRQVEAMEADHDASGCFTDAFNEKDGERTPFLGVHDRMPLGSRVGLEDHIRGQGLPTCTFLFRRAMAEEYPGVHHRFASGDTPLFTLLLCQGPFIFLPQRTAVRTIHPGGIYSMQGAVHHLRVQLVNIEEQDRLSGYRHQEHIRKRREVALTRAWREAMEQRNWELARLAWRHLSKERKLMGWSRWQTVVAGLRIHFPWSYEALLGALRRLRSAPRV